MVYHVDFLLHREDADYPLLGFGRHRRRTWVAINGPVANSTIATAMAIALKAIVLFLFDIIRTHDAILYVSI
jgi:hypothetical protein